MTTTLDRQDLDEGTKPPLDPKRFRALGVIAVAQLMVVLDASVVIIALPSAQRSLHISTANRQWMLTAYTLAFAGLLLLGGRLADYLGRKRMFLISLIGFAAASTLGGLAQTSAMLFSARALQGSSPPSWLRRRSHCSPSPSPSPRNGPGPSASTAASPVEAQLSV
jgi:hypothetical protein